MQNYPPITAGAPHIDAPTLQQALELEKLRLQSEQLKMEQMRIAEERHEREERRERDDRREREERAAAHQRAMHMQYAAAQSQAQAQITATAITANTAMSCAAHRGGAVIYREETYCGPWSWIIGCFVFPCICCCPIDRRQVPVGAAPAAATAAPTPITAMPYPTQPMTMCPVDPNTVTVHVSQGIPASGKPVPLPFSP